MAHQPLDLAVADRLPQRPTQYLLDWLLPVPLPCPHTDLQHCPRTYPDSGGVRQVEADRGMCPRANILCIHDLTVVVFHVAQGGKSAGGDQTKQIEELKTKLAAAEKKAADYGQSMHLLSALTASLTGIMAKFTRYCEETSRTEREGVRPPRH